MIEYIADLKRKIDRSSYHETTHEQMNSATKVLIEYIADFKRNIPRSSYHGTTHDK
jgi:hypothetical protein